MMARLWLGIPLAFVLVQLWGCAELEPVAPIAAPAPATKITTQDGRTRLECQTDAGCVWNITCPDTGEFPVNAIKGGDVEISERCSYKLIKN